MRPSLTRSLLVPLTLHAVAAVLTGSGCGCGRHREDRGTPDQLRLVRLMHATDERKRTCYVMAEVENAGQWTVRQAKVTATLISAGGKTRGVNHYFLKDAKPGERRTLSMAIAAHGSFAEVELTFHPPGEE